MTAKHLASAQSARQIGFDNVIPVSFRKVDCRSPLRSPGAVYQNIDFAKRVDAETIQVSIAHAFPGTELYEHGKQNGLINIAMADEAGHQLPNITYGLDNAALVEAVEQFYGEYYFRPRVIWRVVRKAIFNSQERRRLTKEAREYMALRSKRKRYVSDQREAAAAGSAGD